MTTTWAERLRRLMASIAAGFAAPEPNPVIFIDDEFTRLREELWACAARYQRAVTVLCRSPAPEPRDGGLTPLDIVHRERAALGKALDRMDAAIKERTEEAWW